MLNESSFHTNDSSLDKPLELSKIISYANVVPQKEVVNRTEIFKLIDSRGIHRTTDGGKKKDSLPGIINGFGYTVILFIKFSDMLVGKSDQNLNISMIKSLKLKQMYKKLYFFIKL